MEGLPVRIFRSPCIFLMLFLSLSFPENALAGDVTTVELPSYNLTFVLGDRDDVSLTFGENTVLDLVVNGTDFLGTVELKSADRFIFTLEHRVLFAITENTTFPFHMTVDLRGEYVGRSELQAFSVTGEEIGTRALGAAKVNVYTPFKELGSAATVILTIWLVISYVIMAAKVEPRVLLKKIKPPWGIVMGMVCQFILMPPLAFGLAKAFDLRGALAIGLILVGTCPGGFFSNIEVLLLDCDIVLSLTMTTFSTFLAVGMMPLNLWIYAQPFVNSSSQLQTPFQSLVIQLLALVLPLLLGVPFFERYQGARQFCLKLVKPFTFVLMLLGLVLFIPSQYYIFYGDWKVWTTSAILPLFGAFMGMAIARIANFNYTFSITVAIETGCQNTLLAVSVAKLYYEDPYSDIVSIIPLLIAMVTGFEGIFIAAMYVLGRCVYKKSQHRDGSSEETAGEANQSDITAEMNTNLSMISGTCPIEEVLTDRSEHQSKIGALNSPNILGVTDGDRITWTPFAGDTASLAKLTSPGSENAPAGQTLATPAGRQSVGSPAAAVSNNQFDCLNDGFVTDQHVWV